MYVIYFTFSNFFLDIIVVFALLSIDFQSSTHLCMQFMCV